MIKYQKLECSDSFHLHKSGKLEICSGYVHQQEDQGCKWGDHDLDTLDYISTCLDCDKFGKSNFIV